MNEEQNINNRRDDLPAGAETDGGNNARAGK